MSFAFDVIQMQAYLLREIPPPHLQASQLGQPKPQHKGSGSNDKVALVVGDVAFL